MTTYHSSQQPKKEANHTEKVVEQVRQEITNRKVYNKLVKLFDVLKQ